MINWFEHLYPYTNVHELNLDWILGTVKAGEKEIKNFIGANVIKYANPIAWDISRQYEGNTVVIDPGTGDAYISVKPVPIGYDLSHIEYWTKIFNYGSTVDTLMADIASNEGNSPIATQNYARGDLLFINGVLYETTTSINNGTPFSASNIRTVTLEDHYNTEIDNIKKTSAVIIGDSFCVAGVQQQIAAVFDIDTPYYYGNTGSGYVRSVSAGQPYGDKTFTQLAEQAHSDMSEVAAENVDMVIIYGGINDSGSDISVGDVATASLACFNRVKALFPNALVIVACNGGKLPLYMEYQEKIINILGNAASVGCLALNNVEHTLYNMSNIVDTDNIHPTPGGCRVIAQVLFNAMHGSDALSRIYHYTVSGDYTGHVSGYIAEGRVTLNIDVTCNNPNANVGITLQERLVPGATYGNACGNNVGGTFFQVQSNGILYIFGTTTASTRYLGTISYPVGVRN